MNILSIFDWKIWLIVIIIIIGLFWLFYGGNKDVKGRSLDDILNGFRSSSIPPNQNYEPDDYLSNIPAAGRSKIENRTDIVFTNLIHELGGDVSKIQRNVRLPCIINPETGRRLEFDIYYEDDDVKVAVEVDGNQHSNFPNSFHRNTPEGRRDFEAQKRRDQYKNQAAEDNNICLIRIPHYIANGVDKDQKYNGIKSPQKREKIKDYLLRGLNYCFGNNNL